MRIGNGGNDQFIGQQGGSTDCQSYQYYLAQVNEGGGGNGSQSSHGNLSSWMTEIPRTIGSGHNTSHRGKKDSQQLFKGPSLCEQRGLIIQKGGDIKTSNPRVGQVSRGDIKVGGSNTQIDHDQ